MKGDRTQERRVVGGWVSPARLLRCNTSWLVTATLLPGAVATPTVTRLADMVGTMQTKLVTLAVMVAGSVHGVCGEGRRLAVDTAGTGTIISVVSVS